MLATLTRQAGRSTGGVLGLALAAAEPLLSAFIAGLSDAAFGAPDPMDGYTPTPAPAPAPRFELVGVAERRAA
jgi:hypothetical protein